MIAERDGVVLRVATADDLSAVDELTVEGYRAIYAAVGFDRAVPTVEYWQDLAALNPGSTP